METVAEIGYEEQAGRGRKRKKEREKKERVEVVQGEMPSPGVCMQGVRLRVWACPKDKRGMQKCCTAVVANECVCVFVSFVKRLEIYDATPLWTASLPLARPLKISDRTPLLIRAQCALTKCPKSVSRHASFICSAPKSTLLFLPAHFLSLHPHQNAILIKKIFVK